MLILLRDARTSAPVIINKEHIVSITRGERTDGHPFEMETAIIRTVDGGQYEVVETVKQFDATFSCGRLRPA